MRQQSRISLLQLRMEVGYLLPHQILPIRRVRRCFLLELEVKLKLRGARRLVLLRSRTHEHSD
jgi:hypothetical protein